MEIKPWADGVNRIIENSTSISLGVNALKTSKSENGREQTYLSSSEVPNQYSVSMTFSNSTEDSFYLNHTDSNGNHITEWQAFQIWFKSDLRYGTNCFYFASINDVTGNTPAVYKINSAGLPKGTPNGQYIKVQMQWEEYNPYPITLTQKQNNSDYLDVVNGYVEFHFYEVPDTNPDKKDFIITCEKNGREIAPLVIERCEYDGYKTCVLYYQGFPSPHEGTDVYEITVNYNNYEPITKVLTVSSKE